MSGNALLILVVVLAAVGLGLYFLLGSSGVDAPDPGPTPSTQGASQSEVVAPVAPKATVRMEWTVTRHAGSNPLAGATILAHLVAGADHGPAIESTTDDAGVATFEAPVGEYLFTVRAPGFEYLELRRVLVEGRDETVAVALTEGVTLDGQVVDAAGNPVAGAEVLAQRVSVIQGNRPEFWIFSLLEIQDLRNRPVERAVTAADGRFQFSGLDHGPYRLRASAAGHAEVTRSQVRAGQAFDPLRLGQGRPVDVLIVDPDGQPVDGARITVSARNEASDALAAILERRQPPVEEARTDAEGHASLNRLGGSERYRVEVEAPGHQPYVADWSADSAVLELFLLPGHLLEGVVRDPEGRLLTDALVRVAELGSTVSDELEPDDWMPTDANGRFRLDTLGPEALELIVTHSEYKSTRMRARAGGEPVDITLEPGAAVAGRVIDGETSAPIQGASVLLNDPSGFERRRTTDQDGRFTMTGIHRPASGAGVVTLQLEAPGYARRSIEGVAVAEGEPASLDDQSLNRTGSIRGVAMNVLGEPVEGAIVMVQQPRPGESPEFRQHSRIGATGPGGQFQFDGVHPGEKLIVYGAHSHYLRSTSVPFDLAPGGTITDARVDMVFGGQIAGVVTGENGPLEGVIVAVQTGALTGEEQLTQLRYSVTDAEGKYRIGGLAAGVVAVIADADGYFRKAVSGIEVVEDRAIDWMNFELERGQRLGGQVTDAQGDPVRGVTVTATDSSDGFRRLSSTTDDDGRYTLSPLGKYPVDLRFEASGYVTLERGEVEVGRDDFDVRLERPGRISGRLVDQRGRPVVHFVVVPHVPEGEDEVALRRRTIESPRGRFEIEDLGAGTYRLEFGAPGCTIASRDVVMQTNDQVDLGEVEIERGGVVRGRVVAAETGEPLSRVSIRPQHRAAFFETPYSSMTVGAAPGKPRGTRTIGSTTRTGRDGTFEIIGISTETIVVIFSHDEYLEQKLTLSADEDIEVRMDLAGWVTGIVSAPKGEPLAGAPVVVSGPGIRPRTSVTTRKGGYVLGGLPAGTFNLTVKSPRAVSRTEKFESHSVAIQVAVGQETIANIRLPKLSQAERDQRTKAEKMGPKGRGGAGGSGRGQR